MELEDFDKIFAEIQSYHGIDFNLKRLQKLIFYHLARKRSVAAILKTGFGKSLIYGIFPKILDKVSTLDLNYSDVNYYLI